MQHKAVLPNPAVLQSLKPQYYFFPDQVNLLVQSIITGRFRISTVSYIPMQITPGSQHSSDTDRWHMQSVPSETNSAQSQGTSYQKYRTFTSSTGMSTVPSAIRIVSVRSLVMSILMGSTASHTLATLPNVQLTNLKYSYSDLRYQNMPKGRNWIMAETGCNEVFSLFWVPMLYWVFQKCLYLRQWRWYQVLSKHSNSAGNF